jgi:hypothetical protein
MSNASWRMVSALYRASFDALLLGPKASAVDIRRNVITTSAEVFCLAPLRNRNTLRPNQSCDRLARRIVQSLGTCRLVGQREFRSSSQASGECRNGALNVRRKLDNAVINIRHLCHL